MEVNCIKEACILAFLGVNSWIDIRKKQISLLITVVFAGGGIIWTIRTGSDALDFLLCAGTGLGFVGISIFTEGSVGMGDGWILMALGTMMRPAEFFTMLFVGMLCSAGFAGVMLMVFRGKGHMEIPFVPFLLAGYLGGILL